MSKIRPHSRYSIVTAVLAALTAVPAFAQEAGTPNTDPTLDTMLVTGAEVPIADSIMPTVRPYNAAFGIDENILDVPRNVTIISREQLDAINIQDVRDFSKLTSSSYTTSNFGAPANPSLRGQYADVFVNGMKKSLTNNGNGMPINFNSVESVDIFKGPPTVIYGVSNGYTGGFINFVTKKPYFGKFQGSASFTSANTISVAGRSISAGRSSPTSSPTASPTQARNPIATTRMATSILKPSMERLPGRHRLTIRSTSMRKCSSPITWKTLASTVSPRIWWMITNTLQDLSVTRISTASWITAMLTAGLTLSF